MYRPAIRIGLGVKKRFSMEEMKYEDAELTLRCDVILIAGFLGAGKTTLLRNILKWAGDLSRTALLVNEFGEIGIDGELLRGYETPVVELTNGCICCSIRGDMVRSVRETLDVFHPKRLFIEATGVADPFEVLDFLKTSDIEKRISVPKVVTVLAGDFWEGREYFGPLFYNQIKAAELLLLNKVDLLPKENVPRFLEELKEVNSSCPVVPTHHCQIDPEALWESLANIDHKMDSRFNHDHSDHEGAEALGYVTFAFEDKNPFEADCFYEFMATIPANLYRVKGFALMDGQRFFMNHVGGRTDWKELDEPGPTKLAFIGWQVEKEPIMTQLKGCMKPD